MTGKEYQALAMRTAVAENRDSCALLCHAVFGLNAEAGEVSGLFQKSFQGHKIEREHLLKELGDCLWMIAEACEALETELDTVMQMNIDKLKARYPDGFTVENSMHRKKGDV